MFPAATTTNPPPLSALTTLISSSPSSAATPTTPTTSLTTQILHNLQHQHLWTNLQSHPPHSLSPTQKNPLISGLPPQTIYTHPDEQAYMLEHGISIDDVQTEREWVIPTAQGQAWSLRRLAECFDALPEAGSGVIGGVQEKEGREREGDGEGDGKGKNKQRKEEVFAEYLRRKRGVEWGGKRALLAMVNRGMGGDGTVVYYVVLEGSVKPRQN
ncbi:hypothetical protein AJ79_01207 [Helicocarpus griseus UAMH5409]|uniref:tRNA-splicing endonuclease subunit Sen15 domain-containing protein n=1 Tax=Helicocarpus griseus UAMH5409 TaxID=1447875 RepID=A0A2B7Y8G2_9EURO|nr:hypothetical protein AJ79_01207 [Helicocarpus griseus UAMH5409]